MRSIDLTTYEVEIETPQGSKKIPYDLRRSLSGLLLNPGQRLDAVELLERDKIARKLLDCPESKILLEDAEFERLDAAVRAFHGYGPNEVELVRRVFAAPTVAVKEA